ncbi:MAG TPA: hypothetical protein VNK04_08565 [Gemmataceae bacterium]|nr:hypothetical protein [Gemmataceae bacterium]
MHPFLTRAVLSLSVLGLVGMTGSGRAQYPPATPPPPVVTLGAPAPVDMPSVPFLGARYSFYTHSGPCQSYSYYGPGYVAPMFFNPRYRDAGPYFYTRTYPYADSYYSYYYTPGFFRY